ncbi:hypothetical protein FQN55_007423 [Onygenales sp. PD_40]|nr:hypothetical protein FQN55_007423 [Onygenales sp. PD_40]KAK2805396.1 hypothetical protein FQN51_000222 [Onygenales sp. PD_10]
MYPFENKALMKKYSFDDCLAAIRGERIPKSLGHPMARRCVIRGILYHPGFAKERHGWEPWFTRALNARSIMSDEIPVLDLNKPEHIPYCIWYPETAKETTYRELARRYPWMKYHVGRACAVAGYYDLYKDLDLLPEVHIAEEARDNGHSTIFNDIMSAKKKYSIMDDYTRTVDLEKKPTVAWLNGDTAVRSHLELKRNFHNLAVGNREAKWDTVPENESLLQNHNCVGVSFSSRDYFDITEDQRVDEYTSDDSIKEDVTPLLYTPLPHDLPPIHKDLLILMAAFYGDVDRYARLRRPKDVQTEHRCVIRGIYHNTMFAKWWSLQPNANEYQRAINARFIMNNAISHITPETPDWHLPSCIWYPSRAAEWTYRELARIKPVMKKTVARACIVANYQALYDELDVGPDYELIEEAKESANPHYLQHQERKIEEQGGNRPEPSSWINVTTRRDMFEHSSTRFFRNVSGETAETEPYNRPWLYGNYCVDMNFVELNVCLPDEVKRELEGLNISDICESYSSYREWKATWDRRSSSTS